jgi:hypothetical protein
VVEELVSVGVDVNLRNNYMDTPLAAASLGGHVSVVEELVNAGADVNLQGEVYAPLIAALKKGSLSTIKCLVEHGVKWVTQVVDTSASAVYTALVWNKPDIVKYLVQEQNKIAPSKVAGNVHLFNCLVDIRHTGVKIDRSAWCIDINGHWWETIREGNCDVLRHLLCLGLDANQSIQLYKEFFSRVFHYAVKPLLYSVIDDSSFVKHRTVTTLLEAGADVSVRVRYNEYDSVLDRDGVSVLERTRRQVCKYSKYFQDSKVTEYKRVMWEIKKHVRRHSV